QRASALSSVSPSPPSRARASCSGTAFPGTAGTALEGGSSPAWARAAVRTGPPPRTAPSVRTPASAQITPLVTFIVVPLYLSDVYVPPGEALRLPLSVGPPAPSASGTDRLPRRLAAAPGGTAPPLPGDSGAPAPPASRPGPRRRAQVPRPAGPPLGGGRCSPGRSRQTGPPAGFPGRCGRGGTRPPPPGAGRRAPPPGPETGSRPGPH